MHPRQAGRGGVGLGMASAILAVAVVASLLQPAAAMDYAVGGSGRWDSRGTNYQAWCAEKHIKLGDTMSFKYAASHDVTEVTKAGYDACSGANPIKSYTGGDTTITFTKLGSHYFICSAPGHCAAGMKLEVTVGAATVTAPVYQRSIAPTTPAPAPTKEKGLPTDKVNANQHLKAVVGGLLAFFTTGFLAMALFRFILERRQRRRQRQQELEAQNIREEQRQQQLEAQNIRAKSLENITVVSFDSQDQAEGAADCEICTEGYTQADKVGVLQCTHRFHAICIQKWIADGATPTCPLCRELV